MITTQNIKKMLAEFLGTFMLAYGVALCLGSNLAPATPFVAAFILAFVAYAIGSLTGAHINPAITISIWSVGKISGRTAGLYIVSQIVAGFLALLVAGTYGAVDMASLFPVTLPAAWIAFGAEVVGALIFAFGVSAIVHDNVSKGASGAMAGISLLLGVIFASFLGSLGILNPAVAIGLGVWNAMYIIGPIVGAIIGAQLYKRLHQ